VENLSNLDYTEGSNKREFLNLQIHSFLKNTFDDSTDRIESFDNNVNWFFASVGVKKTFEEEQRDYLERLKTTERYLKSWYDEIEQYYVSPKSKNNGSLNSNIFIIHGHDAFNKLKLEKLLSKEFNLNPIILEDTPHGGKTIIEKFESEAKKTSFAFAIMTPDDNIKSDGNEYTQSRPNVIFELGWFYGRLGRNKVCILIKKGTNIHSDLNGIGRIDFIESIDEKKLEIRKELVNAGINIK